MCGICGIVYCDQASAVSEQLLLKMRDVMDHRGPDDAGHYLADGVALGTRRLSIIDLSERGHMPMKTSDGRYWITYNGEVYNYRQLRALLEDRGYTFQSDTDTEVILNLYADEGPAMLDRLNGMFAIAIWDAHERTLFLARDRAGVKPLYYATQDRALYFASEQKALFTAGIPVQFDQDTWTELLCFRYVAGERTPFIGVKRLLPGHYLLWKDGKISLRRWWNLSERVRSFRESAIRDPLKWFAETFTNSVDLRRNSDVPVGVLLSGGLDSSSVATALSDVAGTGISSFTVRFAEDGYDEGPLAKLIAERCQLDHHELILPQHELMAGLQRASWLNDEPLVHGNDIHLYAISKYAKPHVSVLLSGEGADETLGGYVRYQPLRYPTLLNSVRPILPHLVSLFHSNGRLLKLSRFLQLDSLDRFVLFNACDVLPSDLAHLGMEPPTSFPYREEVFAEAKALYPKEPMRQAMYADYHTFLCSILDRNDRMTMGASIECRLPFLDVRLVEGLAALPSSVLLSGNRTKYLLRETIGKRLPKPVQKHRKWGFGVPWTHYLREVPEFRELIGDLPHLEPIKNGPFSNSKVGQVVRGALKGENDNQELVKQLVMIAVWYQAFFSKPLSQLSKAQTIALHS
jgi:asparagine synthase (glutamine-hydrolysing)